MGTNKLIQSFLILTVSLGLLAVPFLANSAQETDTVCDTGIPEFSFLPNPDNMLGIEVDCGGEVFCIPRVPADQIDKDSGTDFTAGATIAAFEASTLKGVWLSVNRALSIIHFGSQSAVSTLEEVARPSDPQFSLEDFKDVDDRTYRFEADLLTTTFEKNLLCNINPGDSLCPNVPDSIKVRGWYIRGDGMTNDSTGEVHHPLLLMATGLSSFIKILGDGGVLDPTPKNM